MPSRVIIFISLFIARIKLYFVDFRNEPVSDTALQMLIDAEKEHQKNIVANIVRSMQPRINDLHALLIDPPSVCYNKQKFAFNIKPETLFICFYFFCQQRPDIQTTAMLLSPPFGITRLYICTVFTVLLETGNPDIIKS